MQKRNSAVMSIALVTSVGCSAFQPYTQRVTINASDPEAAIVVGGKPVGTGRAEVNLMRNQAHVVTASHYELTGTSLIDKHISPSGVADIVGGCFLIVPFIGYFTPGFWDLSTLSVNVTVPASQRL